MDYIIYFVALVFIIFIAVYINRQIQVSRNIRLEDTTLEKLDEKLKKHKLIGGRHKRTNKKNIFPTPVIDGVGLINKLSNTLNHNFQKEKSHH